ncbi:hypothetical protein LWI29_000610 [Acer saccharum]|uniref:Ubiquitin-like protease family profile domain-containing protein n=1 Tax=Acer saccharum TaxID=4024 RepID=A0AA39ST53_ACESA|nr:hypothetical protein LWI29_000610 [Acer saccharum]
MDRNFQGEAAVSRDRIYSFLDAILQVFSELEEVRTNFSGHLNTDMVLLWTKFIQILDRAGERAEFESGCFGHYLDFPKGGYFQAQFIHSLLLRQIFIPGGSEDELWFALGKTKARFGKREFCLCTGLKFGRLSDIPSREYEVVPGGIHARYFQGRKKVVIADLKAPFMAEDFDRPHDALKLALLLFANRVLFGQDDRNQVAYWMFSLVEDVQAFNNFAWGHYVFKMTLHYIRQGFKVPADPLGPTTRYNLYGFIWALQFWAAEAIPVMRNKCGKLIGDPNGAPRYRKYCFKQRGSGMVNAWTEAETSGKLTGLPELVPTEHELQKHYWRDIDVDLSEGPQWKPSGSNEDEEPTRGSAGRGRKLTAGGEDLSLNRLTTRFIHLTKVQQARLMMPGKKTSVRGKRQTAVGDIRLLEVPRQFVGPEVLERVLNAVNAIPERVRSIVHEEMGADRVRNIVNEGLRREIEGLRRMLGFQVWDGNSGDQPQRVGSGEHAEEGLGGDQATYSDGAGYEEGDDDGRQDDQDWQDDSGCVYDRVNDDQLHYEKHVCVDDISDLDESNLPLALCEDLLSLERAGGLEVAATPSLALRSQFGVDKLFSQMPLYLWPREAGILSLFGIPGLVHPGVPGAEDPDVTQWSLASASPFSNRETSLLLGAPQNMHSCPVSDEENTACQEEELPKEDESLLPLVLWQDPSAHDRPCPVEGRHSGPDYPSEDQSCPMLLAAQNTESCPVSDEGNLQINGEDEDIPKEDESLLALVLWQDPSSQYLPRPVAVTQSGHDDPSEDQTCATLLASQNTQSSPVSDEGGSEKKGEDEDIPDASKVSSTAVQSPPSHPVSPSHSHSHPSVVIKSDSDVEIPTGSPPAPLPQQMSGPAPCSSGEQSSCASTNQRKRRLSAIISQPLPNWEPPVIEVHTDDIRASTQQVLDETALARQRQRELWVRNPYSNPLGRGNLSTGPSEEAYAHFKRDSKLLYRNVGLEVMQTQDFFISLEDNDSHLLDTHVDAYLNLLNKMRGSKTSPYKFKDRMGIVDCNFFDELAKVWAGWQPNLHGRLVQPFSVKDFVIRPEWKQYCDGRRPDWGSPWDSCDKVVVPCKVEDGHRVVCVVDLLLWEIQVYDPKAHWVPQGGTHICQQILPLRRLFPVICLQAGFFNRTGRRTYDSTPMKARRMDEKQVPRQISSKSNGVFVLLMIRSLLRGLKCVKTAERDIKAIGRISRMKFLQTAYLRNVN